MNEDILKRIEQEGFNELEKYAREYPEDIGRLYDSYKELSTQKWFNGNLQGYLFCINDLIIIKKGLWGVL